MSPVSDEEELIERIVDVWGAGPGAGILDQWGPDACFEVDQHRDVHGDLDTVTFMREDLGDWDAKVGEAPDDLPADFKLHYNDENVVDEFEKADSEEELLDIYEEMVSNEDITLEPYADEETLAEKGYVDFAQRVGFV